MSVSRPLQLLPFKKMALKDFKFYKLEQDTEIKPFKCSDEDLNGFLLEDAKNYMQEMLAFTYILEDVQCAKTVAYFSLLNDRISFNAEAMQKTAWNRINRKIPNGKRRGHYPALKIGRLAVSEEYAGQGVGGDILEFIKYMIANERKYGCRFLTLDAYRSAVPFYEKCGFKLLSSTDGQDLTRSMYFDLKCFE